MIDLIFKTKTSFNSNLNELIPINNEYSFTGMKYAFGNLSKTNIFIGENNSGKSRFLRYLFQNDFYALSKENLDQLFRELRRHFSILETVDDQNSVSRFAYIYDESKTRKKILTPLRQIQDGIAESHAYLGMSGGNKGAYWYTQRRLEGDYKEFTGGIAQVAEDRARLAERLNRRLGKNYASLHHELAVSGQDGRSCSQQPVKQSGALPVNSRQSHLQFMNRMTGKRGFVPAGQSSQMIIGATPETDLQIISVSEALYQRFDLKRVFYSAFIRLNDDSALPVIPGGPPLLREHRLYQADWLLRYYGFAAKELLTEQRPNFNVYLDPKCNWAIDHLGMFPVEVNDADYFTLLRVPGIGPKSARRIVSSRKTARLDYLDLKKMGVVLKRAQYFITCSGKMMEHMKVSEDIILNRMIGEAAGECRRIMDSGITYQQLSLFDTVNAGEEASSTGWNLIGCNLPKVGKAV